MYIVLQQQNKMCISALVSNSRNGNSAGQPGEELVGCASAVEAEAVFVQVTLEQRTSTLKLIPNVFAIRISSVTFSVDIIELCMSNKEGLFDAL